MSPPTMAEWQVDLYRLLTDDFSSKCLDDEADRRAVARGIASYLVGRLHFYRSNPSNPPGRMPTYTYGTLPSVNVIASRMGSDGFWYELKGTDARTARRCGIGTYVPKSDALDAEGMHERLWQLIDHFHKGDEEAGDLASSFLYAIGIEWV